MDVLKHTPRLSIMYKLISRSSLQKFLTKENEVNEVCFGKGNCLPVTGALKEHFNNLKLFKQYTFQLPDNSVFRAMPSHRLKRLLTFPGKVDNFLKKHIFLGILNNNNEGKRTIAASLKSRHPVTEIIPRREGETTKATTHDSECVHSIDAAVRVKEGLVQILTPYASQ